MTPRHVSVSLRNIFTCLALSAALFSTPALHAVQVEVVRDGSLVFEQPDDRSAVLDILPRGFRVELVERAGQWSQIILVNPTRKGFIRNEALVSPAISPPRQEEPGPRAPAEPAVPGSERMAPSPGAGTTYDAMMRDLDRTEVRIRSLERMLLDMREMVDTLEIRRLSMPQTVNRHAADKFGRTGTEGREDPVRGRKWSLNAVGGYYFESEDLLIGGALLWEPSRMKGTNIELEAGYLKPDAPEAEGAFLLNLGVLLPLGPAGWRIAPYLAAGAGLVRRENSLPESATETVPDANLGVGAFIRLSNRTRLRTELRTVFEFPDDGSRSDQRVGLGLLYEL